jgi:hypothetical protein
MKFLCFLLLALPLMTLAFEWKSGSGFNFPRVGSEGGGEGDWNPGEEFFFGLLFPSEP